MWRWLRRGLNGCVEANDSGTLRKRDKMFPADDALDFREARGLLARQLRIVRSTRIRQM